MTALRMLPRLIAVVLAVALVTAFAGTGQASASAAVEFIGPASESGYHRANKVFRLQWQENVVATERALVQDVGSLDLDGGCAAAAWGTLSASAPASTSLELQLQPDRCYRWVLTLTTADGSYEATSGAVRTVTGWTGTYNLFHKGSFSTQKGWDWCVGASVQIMLNLIHDQTDHRRATQKTYLTYARANDLTPKRVPGADPRGWAKALTRFDGGTYRDVKSSTYALALKRAAKRMRLTGKPVGVLSQAGNHAIVLNGFSATADPAITDAFTVTAVYVMGPLWPRKGTYDPPPNTRYSAKAFRNKQFFRYRNPFGSAKWSVWEGAFVTINP